MSYFPIKIKYIKLNKIEIIANPRDIKSGEMFIVLETNVKQPMQ